MLIEVPDQRSAMRSRCFCGGNPGASCAETFHVEAIQRFRRSGRLLFESREGHEEVGAEVLRDRVGGTARARGATYQTLCAAEETFERVGCGRDTLVVEADEQMAAVTLSKCGDVIDKASCDDPDPGSRSGPPELVDVGLEPGFGLRGAGGTVDSIGVGRQLMGEPAKDGGVPGYPTRESDLVPVRSEGLGEVVEQRVARVRPFFRASCANARTFSRRSWRRNSGGSKGAFPLTREFCRTRRQISFAKSCSVSPGRASPTGATVTGGATGGTLPTEGASEPFGAASCLPTDEVSWA